MKLAAVVRLALALICPGIATPQKSLTLADVLKQNTIPVGSTSNPAHLDEAITSYATLNTGKEFLIAYYLDDSHGELHFPLLLSRFDKALEMWQEASLNELKVLSPTGALGAGDDCLGSAVHLAASDNWYYLDLHLSPSAGCLVVLNRDLTVRNTLAGWVKALSKSGTLVYEGNMVHFAPLDPLTLFLYDPLQQKSEKIYPQSDDPFRKAFTKYLKNVINKKTCQENNWVCDPGEFESFLTGSIKINDQTHSLAFCVKFDTRGFLRREDAEPRWDNGKPETAQSESNWKCVYVYTLTPALDRREFPFRDLQAQFGVDSLGDLLTPEKLHQIFATLPSN